jgi:hypothetical protein
MSKAAPTPLGATLIRKGDPIPPVEQTPTDHRAPPPKLGTIAVTLRLDPDRYEQLKAEAAATRRTNQDILRDALDAYLRTQARTHARK